RRKWYCYEGIGAVPLVLDSEQPLCVQPIDGIGLNPLSRPDEVRIVTRRRMGTKLLEDRMCPPPVYRNVARLPGREDLDHVVRRPDAKRGICGTDASRRSMEVVNGHRAQRTRPA